MAPLADRLNWRTLVNNRPQVGQTLILLTAQRPDPLSTIRLVNIHLATYKAFGPYEDGLWTWDHVDPNEAIIEQTPIGWLPIPINTYKIINDKGSNDANL